MQPPAPTSPTSLTYGKPVPMPTSFACTDQEIAAFALRLGTHESCVAGAAMARRA
uniref:Predicted protein n=1 Tax=Hordeum vulgare subsp. vulgare TaxID=112509 RepID=F2EKW9_HORVV|nr:predicted protein [Hordeum vulgare subsp. vulgare]